MYEEFPHYIWEQTEHSVPFTSVKVGNKRMAWKIALLIALDHPDRMVWVTGKNGGCVNLNTKLYLRECIKNKKVNFHVEPSHVVDLLREIDKMEVKN